MIVRVRAEEGDGALGDEWLTVESLDLEGQGVARSTSGKVVFVEGALPGEQVQVDIEKTKNNWARGSMRALRRESAQRVMPRCPHFGVCGGCRTQHLDPVAQVAVKQRALEDGLWHVGKVKPELVMRPVIGPAWGYRHRARMSIVHLPREERVLIGFHERKSNRVADIRQCPVMPAAMSALIDPLHDLIMSMDQRQSLPQIEVAVGVRAGVVGGIAGGVVGGVAAGVAVDIAGDAAGNASVRTPSEVIALVLRHTSALGKGDLARLRGFGTTHGVQWWLQPAGPESARRLDAGSDGDGLSYELPEFGIRMPYRPTDFTQVNPGINRILVSRALQLLDPGPGDSVIDWFCGMGNFTLPMARRGATVKGVEGSRSLVEQARSNARLHGLQRSAGFDVADLFAMTPSALQRHGAANKWLVDPPRDGCFALVKALAAAIDDAGSGYRAPSRIVYISCDPSTLARDADVLVHRAGYRCSAAGVVNMFPHTAHVESVAVFERAER